MKKLRPKEEIQVTGFGRDPCTSVSEHAFTTPHCSLSYNPYPDLDCGHLRLHDWGNGAQKRHVPHLSLSGDEFSPRFLEGYKKPLSLPPVGCSVSKFPRAGMTAMWCHILPPLQPDSCAGKRIRAGRLCASTPAWGVAGIPRKEF